MLHFLSILKGTNYASYMTNYSHIKIVNFIRFSLIMQCKTKDENISRVVRSNIIEDSTIIPKELFCLSLNTDQQTIIHNWMYMTIDQLFFIPAKNFFLNIPNQDLT